MVLATNEMARFLLLIIFFSFVIIFVLPICFGLIGTILPSFGNYLELSSIITLDYYKKIFFLPGIKKSIFLSIFVGILSTFLSLFLSQLILSKVFFTKHFNF